MRQQKYGRILNCVSGAGLYGNFGQVNYAAMKMGLVGFTVALNQEGPCWPLLFSRVEIVCWTLVAYTVVCGGFCCEQVPSTTSL